MGWGEQASYFVYLYAVRVSLFFKNSKGERNLELNKTDYVSLNTDDKTGGEKNRIQIAGPDKNSVLRNSMSLIFLTLTVGPFSENGVQASLVVLRVWKVRIKSLGPLEWEHSCWLFSAL